ncbi:MAG: helix-turn-helix transcriptional regulator [Microcoleaceae cyanobacterium]
MGSVFTHQYKIVLKYLIFARKSAGITQQKLAEKLGKPQSFVSKYERGERRLDIVEFLIIARALEADPYRLLREAESQASDNYSKEDE